MDKNNRAATLCAILGNGIFGFSFMFSRIALNITEPFVMLAYRFIFTLILLMLISLAAKGRANRQADNGEIYWLRLRLSIKELPPLLLLGLVQPVGYFLCESYGISLTNATVSGVIIALAPVAAIIGGAVVLREIPKKAQVVYSVLSVAGVCALTFFQSEGGSVHPLGIVLLLGAVVTGSMFNVLSRRLSKDYSVLERTVVMMALAAITFTVLAVITCKGDFIKLILPLKEPMFLLSIAYLSVCSSVIAFMALNFANNRLPAVKTTAFANLTTIISLFAGAVFLGEPFSIYTLLISAGIIFCITKVQKG